jgi:hypothetical protein
MEEQNFNKQLHVCCTSSCHWVLAQQAEHCFLRQYSSVLGAAVASVGLLLHAWLQVFMQSLSLFKDFLYALRFVDHQSECNCRAAFKNDTC